jgi:hypothetical protein
MHRYWDLGDPQMRAVQDAQFWKNLSLAGGAVAWRCSRSTTSPKTTW